MTDDAKVPTDEEIEEELRDLEDEEGDTAGHA